jgi:hypothetical protein
MNNESFKRNEIQRNKKGVFLFSGDPVEIIGEQIAELDDGRVVEQYFTTSSAINEERTAVHIVKIKHS